MFGMGTGGSSSLWSPKGLCSCWMNIDGQRSVSIVNFMVKPNGLLVTVSSTYCYAYTSVLSTW